MNKILFLIFTILLTLGSNGQDSSPESNYKRLISMSPAISETLFTFGLGEKVVGVSDYCFTPKGENKFQKVGTPFTPKIEKIVSLKPQVILTQNIKDTKFVNTLNTLKIKFHSYDFNNLKNIQKSINRIVQTYKGTGVEEFNTDWLKTLYQLRNKQMAGNYLAVIGIKGDIKKIKGFVVAADDTYLGEILSATGLTNLSPQEKGYGDIGLESFIKQKLHYLVFFTKNKELTKAAIEKQLKKQFKDVKIKEILIFNQDYTLVPGPGVLSLMKEVLSVL